MSKEDIYYKAIKNRDPAFDGKFFFGVKTTGIYCRPICPAKPKKENIVFFKNPEQAEAAGYRSCLRCRPESAPQSAAWIGKAAMVRRAVKMIENQKFDHNEDQFAEIFGVSARHLRRVFISEIGKTPKQLFSEIRLTNARKMLTESDLPITDIAFNSGFQSVRRFNDAFKAQFKKTPSQLRG